MIALIIHIYVIQKITEYKEKQRESHWNGFNQTNNGKMSINEYNICYSKLDFSNCEFFNGDDL